MGGIDPSPLVIAYNQCHEWASISCKLRFATTKKRPTILKGISSNVGRALAAFHVPTWSMKCPNVFFICKKLYFLIWMVYKGDREAI